LPGLVGFVCLGPDRQSLFAPSMQAGVGQVIKTMLEVIESGGETTRTLSVVSSLMDWLQLLIIAVIIRFRELFGQPSNGCNLVVGHSFQSDDKSQLACILQS
jgi:hypothetical protein